METGPSSGSNEASQQTAPPASSGLSAGAAAGATVAAILGALLLLGIAAFFVWRAKGRPQILGEKTRYVYRPAGTSERHSGQMAADSNGHAELAGSTVQPSIQPPREHEVGIESTDRK